MDNEGIASMLLPNNAKIKSQELPNLFRDAGQMYIGTVENWLTAKEILNSKVQVLEVDPQQFVDIDSVNDWELAEMAFMEKEL
jgi:N-acylneuraminate cytidylyltransferase